MGSAGAPGRTGGGGGGAELHLHLLHPPAGRGGCVFPHLEGVEYSSARECVLRVSGKHGAQGEERFKT